MTEPELERIRRHLENIVGERNPFTRPKHLESTAQYISDQLEAMGLKVTRETVEFEGIQSKNILSQIQALLTTFLFLQRITTPSPIRPEPITTPALSQHF